MDKKNIDIDVYINSINEIIKQDTELGKTLWQELQQLHPADIAEIFANIKDKDIPNLFLLFSKTTQLELFQIFPNIIREKVVLSLDDQHKAYIFHHTPIDDLTDLFDHLSDYDLKKCLEVLHKKERQRVLSLLKFPADSAGGIMTIDMVTLMEDSTVEQSIHLLQRLKPNVDLHKQIYVTNRKNKLAGFINLEDLVLKSPQTRISSILKYVPYTAFAEQDQEEVAQQMIHYHMMTVPVINKQLYLLGVIPGETLIDVIQQEATEDVQRISGSPITDTESYFNIPLFTLFYQRSLILVTLLIAQSLTSIIIGRFESILTAFLVSFFTMLVSTGGNTSSQTSAILIQGMSSGDINESNVKRFLKREFIIGLALALLLSTVAFIRVYSFKPYFMGSLVVSLSLGLIVLFSVVLGAISPILLKKIGIDPAFSAGPFLATIMDILGIFVYCYVAYLALS